MEHERLRVARRGQPAADAHLLGAARLHRARGRVRVPLRDVQHRRAGPVPRRRNHGRLDRLVAAPAALASCTSSSQSSPVRSQAPPGRGIAGLLKATRRRPRGDHDDHAQLDRDLGRRLPLRPGRAVTERHAGVRARVERRARRVEAEGLLGRPAPAGAPRRLLPRDLRPRRLLDHAQPHDARLRGARGRLQPRGGALRRHLGRAQLLPGDGDLRHVRWARRSDRHRRLAVQDQHERRAPHDDRVHRNRGRPPGAKHGDRRRALCALVRRAHHRHVDAQPRSGDLPSRPRVEPDPPDPGSRRALRRRRRADPLGASVCASGGAGESWRRRNDRAAARTAAARQPRGRVARDPRRPRRLLGRAAAALDPQSGRTGPDRLGRDRGSGSAPSAAASGGSAGGRS